MLKKIKTEQLIVGMYVARLAGSWLQHPFWRRAFLLEQDEQIHAIVESGISHAWIDPSRGLDLPDDPPRSADAPAAPPADPARAADPAPDVAPAPPAPSVSAGAARPGATSFERERADAQRLYAQSKPVMQAMFHEARLGRAIDRQGLEDLVGEISASLQRNATALISVARLKSADEYTYMHSVAVCALMMALARELGIDEPERVRELGLAGMLHDIGKAGIPLEILNKPGKVSAAEFEVMRSHPARGAQYLQDLGLRDEVVLDVCRHHHERIDGAGYPDRQAEPALSLPARMAAVCDVYDAITSDRPYKRGWDPAESMRRMAAWAGDHLDRRVFHAFVKSLGIYPVGSLVRLESGLLGVVVEQSKSSLLQPRVRVFYSTARRAYVRTSTIDLASASTNERIAGPEDAATWGIENPARFLA